MPTKFTREQCAPVVEYVMKYLAPCCEMIEVAGSYRREKPEVSDIEFVFVPKIESKPDGFFDSVSVNLADEQIGIWLTNGLIAKRATEDGRVSSWAKLNKHAVHVETGIAIDFFCEPDRLDWFRTLVIRTGPKDFNIKLMATAPKVGIIPHAYGEAFFKTNGERVFANSEREVLALCGLAWSEPKDRK